MSIILDPKDIDWQKARRFVYFLAAAGLVITGFLLLYQALVVPIGVSLFLSFLLAPLVANLDRNRIPRALVVSLILALTLGLIAIAFFKVVPALYSEILDLIQLIPKAYDKFTKTWLPSLREYVLDLELITAVEFDEFVRESRNLTHLTDKINQALSTLWATAPHVLGILINFVLIPLLTFFILRDYERIKARLRTLIPRDLEKPVIQFTGRVSDALRDAIKGQAIVAGILACLYVTGLSMVGLQGAVAIGLLSGICRLIPYLDVIVGGSLSLIVVLSDFKGAGHLLAVSGVFLAVQSLDGMLITPRIIGDRVGLHPILVIVSIIAFGELFGFWGVLLAIPCAAVAKVTWYSAKPFYLASKAYDIEIGQVEEPPGGQN